MKENEIIKEVQKYTFSLLEDDEIKRMMLILVKSGKTPAEVAEHIYRLIIKYVLNNKS